MSEQQYLQTDPFGPDDPFRLAIRQAYSVVPNVPGATDPAIAVEDLWVRLGWSDPESSATRLLIGLGPRYPGLSLLENSGITASTALRILVKQEIEDALGLNKSLPTERLTKWATDRVCGQEPVPENDRRRFLMLVAGVIREFRESASVRTLRDRGAGYTTLAELAGATLLEIVASQESEAALGLARASRKLETQFPELGEVLLLHYYAGLPLEEVAALTCQTIVAVKQRLVDGSDWVLLQTV